MDALDPVQLGFIVRGLTVLVGAGLAIISFEAYRRRGRRLLLIVSLAFLAYLVRDLIHFAEVVTPQSTSSLTRGLADVLDLVTLVLLFFSVLKE